MVARPDQNSSDQITSAADECCCRAAAVLTTAEMDQRAKAAACPSSAPMYLHSAVELRRAAIAMAKTCPDCGGFAPGLVEIAEPAAQATGFVLRSGDAYHGRRSGTRVTDVAHAKVWGDRGSAKEQAEALNLAGAVPPWTVERAEQGGRTL